MTNGQKRKLGNLMAEHRAFEGCADYFNSPTMNAVFRYVDKLIDDAFIKGGAQSLMKRALKDNARRFITARAAAVQVTRAENERILEFKEEKGKTP